MPSKYECLQSKIYFKLKAIFKTAVQRLLCHVSILTTVSENRYCTQHFKVSTELLCTVMDDCVGMYIFYCGSPHCFYGMLIQILIPLCTDLKRPNPVSVPDWKRIHRVDVVSVCYTYTWVDGVGKKGRLGPRKRLSGAEKWGSWSRAWDQYRLRFASLHKGPPPPQVRGFNFFLSLQFFHHTCNYCVVHAENWLN